MFVSPAPKTPAPSGQPHDFEAQKAVHQRIRNDADYDDWEYGTEPLPHESWLEEPQDPASDQSPS